MSTSQIMIKLKSLTIHHMIIKDSIMFIHKVIFNNEPPAITKFITYSLSDSQNIRSIHKPMIKNINKSEKATQSLLYRSIFFINKIPDHVRLYNPKKL